MMVSEFSNINVSLAAHRNIPKDKMQCLDHLTGVLDEILQCPEIVEGDALTVSQIVFSLENTLQLLWGFNVDPKFHKYQHRIKGCSCPKMDNDDNVGVTDQRWTAGDCPWHGGS